MSSLTTTQLKKRIAKVKANKKIITKEEYEGKPVKTKVKPMEGKKVDGKKVRRRSILQEVNKLLTNVGVDKVTYSQMEKVAKEVKPTTKFNKTHFAWYKTKYREQH